MGKIKHPLPWFIGLLTAGVVGIGAIAYITIEMPSSRSELEKRTVIVQQQNLTLKIQASGTVEPVQSVNISPKEPGRLIQLFVEQGQQVKKGQRLAVMENTELQVQGIEAQARVKQAIANLKQAQTDIPAEIARLEADLRQSQASLFQAQASLKESQNSLPRQIDQAKAQVASAQSRFKLATERAKRYQELLRQGAIAQDRFDETMNEYRSAEASLFEAQQAFEQAKIVAQPQVDRFGAAVAESQMLVQQKKIAFEQKQRSAQDEIDRLKAEVEQAQAQLKLLEVKFVDTIITAPFDGIVTQRYTTVGAFVTPTTSASSTASATSSSILALARGLKVIAKVPEVDIGQLKPGQLVEIVADAYPDEVFRGQIVLIAPEAIVENNVTSFEVQIAVDKNGQEKLLSKMNVDVTFLGKPIQNAVVIPTVAIVTQEGETGVMVPDENNKPKFQPVIIGVTLNNQTQVLQGLNPGDRVFIDPPEEKESNR